MRIFHMEIKLLCNKLVAMVPEYLLVEREMVIIEGSTELRLASYQDCDAFDLDLG